MRMEYEMLLRNAFSCGRFGDPFALANADVFDNNIINAGHRLRFGISAALKKVMRDMQDEGELYDELELLDQSVWHDDIDQQEMSRIISRATEIFDELDIR